MDDTKLIKQIQQRDARLKTQAEAAQANHQQIVEQVVPFMSDVVGVAKEITETRTLGRKQFNSHAEYCLSVWCKGLQGYAVSPSSMWFAYTMERAKVKDSLRLKKWLQDTQEHMMYAYARSNFYSAIGQATLFGGALGTAIAFTQEDIATGAAYVNVVAPRDVRIAQNAFGRVDVIHREFTLTTEQAIKQFGEDKLSLEITRDAKKKPDQEHTFLHVLWPQIPNPNRADYAGKSVLSLYLEWGKNPKIIRKSGYNSPNAHVWRIEQLGKNPWGIGPTEKALVECGCLNQVTRDLLEISQLSAHGPVKASASLKGKLKLKPRAITWVEGPDEEVAPIHTNINYPVGRDREQDLKDALNRRFNVDFFMMLMNSERAMTATEVVEKQSEKAALQAPEVDRFARDFLQPVNEHLYVIEREAGRLPELPPELEDMAGEDIKIDFIGPMFQLQKRRFSTNGLVQGLAAIEPVFAIAPETKAKINWSEVVDILADGNGMPAAALVSEEDYEKVLEAQAQQQKMQEEMQMASELADSAGKLQGPTDPNSPLAQITEAG